MELDDEVHLWWNSHVELTEIYLGRLKVWSIRVRVGGCSPPTHTLFFNLQPGRALHSQIVRKLRLLGYALSVKQDLTSPDKSVCAVVSTELNLHFNHPHRPLSSSSSSSSSFSFSSSSSSSSSCFLFIFLFLFIFIFISFTFPGIIVFDLFKCKWLNSSSSAEKLYSIKHCHLEMQGVFGIFNRCFFHFLGIIELTAGGKFAISVRCCFCFHGSFATGEYRLVVYCVLDVPRSLD